MSAQPDKDRSLTATDTENQPATNLMVNPATGLLPLSELTGTNSATAAVPDLAPATNAAPATDTTNAANTNGATTNDAPAADDATDTNDATPFDANKDAKVGVADLVPADSLSSLSREDLEKKVSALSDDLTTANTASEYFRQQYRDLRLRDDALGVDALTVDELKLEDKLVQAVKELYQSEMRRREALLLLDRLRTTTEALLKTAPNYDPKTRADYEVAMRASRDYLAGRNGTSIPLGLSLADAQVADLNPALNAVVLNVGKAQGVKEGMPFLVYQNNAQVGRVKIVLARDLVSAGLVENLEPNVKLKVGDRVAVETQ
jgi:hypothetical protein